MEKRYQVFVSSTYEDLRVERQQIIQALLELDCIPAGMELFPASDFDQWNLIKEVIDDSDYYIVVIGGRYGSPTSDGLSYTEREFDYALQAGKPVLAFLHKSPGEIKSTKAEKTPEGKEKLKRFREKVQTGRVCKYWTTPEELGGQVSRALIKSFKQQPAEGWVRGRHAAGTNLLKELESLRGENQSLRRSLEISKRESPAGTENYAGGSDTVEVTGTYTLSEDKTEVEWSQVVTWDELFEHMGPLMLSGCEEDMLRQHLVTVMRRRDSEVPSEGVSAYSLNKEIFQSVLLQFKALGLVSNASGAGKASSKWTLTPYGESYLIDMKAIKKEE